MVGTPCKVFQSLPTLPGRFNQMGGSGQIAMVPFAKEPFAKDPLASVPVDRGEMTWAGGAGDGSRQRKGLS